MYISDMAKYTITEARENLAAAITKSAVEEVFFEKHGKVVAVMLSPVVYERLTDAWEDLHDLKMLAEMDFKEDGPGIPMEQVFRELGTA
jgi:PHD/YefM family antitoxin component YafN of YafNO toxin-antitoxin module